MAILAAAVSVEGKRPLLWNHFTPAAMQAEAGRRSERTGTKGNDPAEWKRTMLATGTGQLYLEPNAVFSCIRDAGRYTRMGKSSLQPLIAATVQVLDDRLPLNRNLPKNGAPLPTDPEKPVYLDIRMVRNPNTRGRNVRYRVAASPGWRATFKIAWDASIVSREQLRAVLNDAGALVGLGDGRNIGFGRFVVTEFQVLEQPVSNDVQTPVSSRGGARAAK
jgi:hypothetical protein